MSIHSSEPIIRIGFIGTGFVSLMHQPAIAKTRNAVLAGVYDQNKELMERKAREWGVAAYESIDEMVQSPLIDVVYVLTPVEHHYEHAARAISAGKHVFIEKPVGLSVVEIQKIAELARQAGIHCIPGHNYIYNPSLWRIKRMIDRGDLGEIAAGWIHYCVGHADEIFTRYPGVITQIVSHHAYTLLYLLGRPKRLFAMASEGRSHKLGKEDQVFINIEMPNGALVNLFVSVRTDDFTAQPWPFMVKILGTKGGGMHTWREGVNNRQVGTHPETWIPYDESYEFLADHLINSVILGTGTPLSTIEDAVDTQLILDAAIRSAADGEQIVLNWDC
jgi:predicted dehydrogenase